MSRKRGLGRGLDSLLAPEAVTTLEVGKLAPNPKQPRRRFDPESLEELASSIRAQGIVQPIVVTPEGEGRYTIIAGERRWRAARRAGLEVVPVSVRAINDDRERLELALVENLQRSDLDAIEEAEAYRGLRDEFQLSQEEIATRVGKSRPAVANALRLLNLPDEIQDMLRDGRLKAGQARPLLAIGHADKQVALAERAVAESLSARELERLAGERRARAKPPRAEPTKDVHTVAAEEELARRLQTAVEIHRRRRGGELRIRFHSEEELMRLYDLLCEGGKR